MKSKQMYDRAEIKRLRLINSELIETLQFALLRLKDLKHPSTFSQNQIKDVIAKAMEGNK